MSRSETNYVEAAAHSAKIRTPCALTKGALNDIIDLENSLARKIGMNDFEKSIPEIEKIIGYEFRDKSLLMQAFTRSSFCNEANVRAKVPYQSNEVLEFFGDSVLSAAIVTMLIQLRSERYPHGTRSDLKEGDFSNIRSSLSDKKNLSDNITRLGLEKMLIMGDGDSKLGIENERSVKEDLFESIIGAIYIDSGFNMERIVYTVGKMLDISVYFKSTENAPKQSYKNTLQEWCADKKRQLAPPIYRVVNESGPDHDKSYTVECTVDGVALGRGTARSRKLAEGQAAREALIAIGVIEAE